MAQKQPETFRIFLAWFGRSPTFDRAWSTFSILLMGLLATLFTFDLWVA